MHLSNNNKASTALSVFKNATLKKNAITFTVQHSLTELFYQFQTSTYLMERILTFCTIEKGSEITSGITAYFIWMQGSDRSSVITGKSVHNIRIERHWWDVRVLCMGKYLRDFCKSTFSCVGILFNLFTNCLIITTLYLFYRLMEK